MLLSFLLCIVWRRITFTAVFLISRAWVTCNDIAAPPHTLWRGHQLTGGSGRRRRQKNRNVFEAKTHTFDLCLGKTGDAMQCCFMRSSSPLKFCPLSDYFLMTSLFVLLSLRNTVSCSGCSPSREATMLLAFKHRTVLYLSCSQARCLSVLCCGYRTWVLLNLKMDDYRNVLAINCQ